MRSSSASPSLGSNSLTPVPISGTRFKKSRSVEGRLRPRVLLKGSECGARARNDTLRSRAASGIMLTGTTTGPGGAFPGLGQAGAGNARVRSARSPPPGWGGLTGSSAPAASQEAWPGVAPKGPTPRRQEPRWNADRRARPAGRAPHARWPEVGYTRLSAFRFLFSFACIVGWAERSETHAQHGGLRCVRS